MKSLLIAIDGIDGSGKGTQIELLAQRFAQEGYEVETFSFPQYGEKSAGLVEEYLNGKYGTAEEVGPYAGSIFFAVDRYAASFKIRTALNAGKIILLNRYVSANMGHQGGKIKDAEERKKFFAWDDNLEYEIFKLPRPNLSIILHVGAVSAQKLVDQKEKRDYIENDKKRDIHEDDIEHLQNAEKVFLEMAEMFTDFTLVNCIENNEMLSREKVHAKIWDIILKKLAS